jgi:hypothetical protein
VIDNSYLPITSIIISDPGGRAVYGVGLSTTGIAGSNPAMDMDAYLSYIVCSQVEVFATGRSLVQRISTYCDVSDCDRGTSSTFKRRIPTRAVEP